MTKRQHYGYTAVSRKVVGKSARDNPERYCGWFCLPCSPKKLERMAREATDICLRLLMESNKSRFNSYSSSEHCIDHITYYLSGLSRTHFSDNLSRNSCILLIFCLLYVGVLVHGNTIYKLKRYYQFPSHVDTGQQNPV